MLNICNIHLFLLVLTVLGRFYRSVSAFCPDPDLDSGKKADPDPDQKDPDLKH